MTNDNALAAYTLETLGVESELAATLHASLKRYGYSQNSFIETVWDVPVPWPLYHHADKLVTQIGQDRVFQEVHDGQGYFYDWFAFSNLAFMAATSSCSSAAGAIFNVSLSSLMRPLSAA